MSHAAGGGTETALRASVAAMGALRLAIAGWAAARPQHVAGGLGVRAEQRADAVPYVYALAGRELALGVGTLAAWRRGSSGAGWMAAIALADAFDAVAYRVLAELGTLDESRARRGTMLAISGVVPESILAVVLARRAR